MTKKKMSPLSIFLLGVDSMIGSAAFLLPGNLYAKAGNMIVLILILSGLSALTLALCYAGMASRTTGNGVGWLYAYNEFVRFAGFEVGLFTWIQGILTIATEIAAFLTALKIFFPQLNNLSIYRLSGIMVIILISIIGVLGQKVSDIANDTATIIKLGILILFIVVGVWFIHGSNYVSSNHYSLMDYNGAYSNVFYMYTGFAFLPVAAAEMTNPEKNLPKEMLAVIISVVTVYVLGFLVVIGMLRPKIAHDSAPLAIAFANHFGLLGKLIITFGTVGSILGVAISLSYSTPFIVSSLANEHELLPHFLGIKSKKGSPWVAIILTALLCILLFLSGNYLFLVPCSVIVSLVQYFMTSLGMLKVQWKKKGRSKVKEHGFQLKGGIIIPSIALIVCIYILINLEKKVIIFGSILLGCGIVIYIIDFLFKKIRN